MPRVAISGVPQHGKSKHGSSRAHHEGHEQPRKKVRANIDGLGFAREAAAPNLTPGTVEALLYERVIALLADADAAGTAERASERARALAAAPVRAVQEEAAKAAAVEARMEASYWKGQFEALRDLRETEPERRLAEVNNAEALTSATTVTPALILVTGATLAGSSGWWQKRTEKLLGLRSGPRAGRSVAISLTATPSPRYRSSERRWASRRRRWRRRSRRCGRASPRGPLRPRPSRGPWPPPASPRR